MNKELEIEKIKVKYNIDTGIILGNFPNKITYKNNIIDEVKKTIDGDPYIEITKEQHESSISKIMCIVDGVYQEYKKTEKELLNNAKKLKKNEINRVRDHYLSQLFIFEQDGKKHPLSKNVLKDLFWLDFLGKKASAPYVTEDNGIIEISKEEYKRIAILIGSKKSYNIKQARLHKDKILSMKDIKEIEDYPIDEILLKE